MRLIHCLLVTCLLSAPAAAPAQQAQQAQQAEGEQQGDEDASTHPNVAGTWAQRIVTTAISEVPIIGEVTTRTISVLKVDISQDGTKLEMASQACDIQVHTSVDIVETKIPERFIAAKGIIKRPARLVEQDGEYRLDVPRMTEVLGAKLRVPGSEHLPTEADDPRVFDQDKDGKPGMTVQVSGMIDGSLYIVHRGWDRLLGSLTGKDRIDGQVQWDLEQSVVDSTSIFLGDSPDSRAHPDASKNHFRMRRVSNGADCQAIIKRRASLF